METISNERPSGFYLRAKKGGKPFTSWKKLADEEALERGQGIVTRNSVTGEKDLQTRFRGLFVEMYRRSLLDSLDFSKKPVLFSVSNGKKVRGPDHWDDDELIARAREAIAREGFPDMGSFGRRYKGINFELARRGLSDLVEFQASA